MKTNVDSFLHSAAISVAGCAGKKNIKPAVLNLPEVVNESNLVNPFEIEGIWYRANLHTHTTLSDGDVNLPIRIKQYRDKGYKCSRSLTMKKQTIWPDISDANIFVISGMETHPVCPGAEIKYHFVCLNVPHGLKFADEVNAQDRIRPGQSRRRRGYCGSSVLVRVYPPRNACRKRLYRNGSIQRRFPLHRQRL